MSRIARIALLALLLPACAQADLPSKNPEKHPCDLSEVQGSWKLKWVFEEPEGALKQEYRRAPQQYFVFADNQTYAAFASRTPYSDPIKLESAMRDAAGETLRQYLLSEEGVLYMYENGRVKDAYYCEVVDQTVGRFARGDMVLSRSSEDAEPVEIVKIYQRPVFGAKRPPGEGNAPRRARSGPLNPANQVNPNQL